MRAPSLLQAAPPITTQDKEARAASEPRVFDEYLRDFKRSGRPTFKTWSTPVLIRADANEEPSERTFRTVQVGASHLAAMVAAGAPASLGSVHLIVKRAGAAFPERIGVGRAPNTDICLSLPRLSKYHAYFTFGPNGSVLIADADSKNGTMVAGRRLGPMESVALEDGVAIRLGPYSFVFYGPQGFVDLLAQRAAR